MFILFGFGKKTVKDYDTHGEIKCRRCNNEKAWVYKKVTTWFTLFFIPVIPYSTKYVRVCPICGEYDQLKKEAFMAIVEDGVVLEVGAEASDLAEAGKKEDYQGMTETQANYLREMKALKEEREQSS